MTGQPDSRGDGDGWVECAHGHRHWGLFGSAGLLAHRADAAGDVEVLLQHRATWSHHGGTWGLLGGARQRDETALRAALREAGEEGGLLDSDVEVHGGYDDEHGGWAYTTVLAVAGPAVAARPTGGESIDVAWVAASSVTDLSLHPGFAAAWPILRGTMAPLSIVVDAANVVGSTPDGWWRDRPGAARRLVEHCRLVASAGVATSALPGSEPTAPLARRWPHLVVVVEGQARSVATEPPPRPVAALRPVEVVAAEHDGDDEIVATVRRVGGGPVLVVTADRGLRARVQALGAEVVGPRWLTQRLDLPAS